MAQQAGHLSEDVVGRREVEELRLCGVEVALGPFEERRIAEEPEPPLRVQAASLGRLAGRLEVVGDGGHQYVALVRFVPRLDPGAQRFQLGRPRERAFPPGNRHGPRSARTGATVVTVSASGGVATELAAGPDREPTALPLPCGGMTCPPRAASPAERAPKVAGYAPGSAVVRVSEPAAAASVMTVEQARRDPGVAGDGEASRGVCGSGHRSRAHLRARPRARGTRRRLRAPRGRGAGRAVPQGRGGRRGRDPDDRALGRPAPRSRCRRASRDGRAEQGEISVGCSPCRRRRLLPMSTTSLCTRSWHVPFAPSSPPSRRW